MNVLCLYCERLTPLNEFRLEGEVLFIRCERCHLEPFAERRDEAWHRKLAAEGPPPEAARPENPGVCPKCIEPRDAGATACRACGVVFAAFRPESMRLTGRLESLWETARLKPADEEALKHLLEAARDTGALPHVGRLYRLALLENPRDIPALTGLAELRAFSVQELSPGAPPAAAPARSRRLPLLLLVAAGVLLGLLGWTLRWESP